MKSGDRCKDMFTTLTDGCLQIYLRNENTTKKTMKTEQKK